MVQLGDITKSIALPFWEWLAKRIRPYLGENPTMASRFPFSISVCRCLYGAVRLMISQ
jgi:hypothetical protein